MATTTQKPTRNAPTMPSGDSRSRSTLRNQLGAEDRRGATLEGMVLTLIPWSSREADARIEEHIGEVADDLRRHDDEHGEQRCRLHRQNIVVQRRLDDHAAEAGK